MALLAGRSALVTGAARGNGAAIARVLAGEGARVALYDIDGLEAAAEAQRIAEATGAATFGGRADVTHAADVEAAVAQTAETFGQIDILVNLTGPLRFVNAVPPGIIHTDLTKDLYADPVAFAEIVGRIPLGHIADPVEVANAVLYLVSDLAAYVTGTELLVDAGYALR
jgi:NAD(P)-dependent dehydrogenase (short-subunit alcohol dehydrogenase family)